VPALLDLKRSRRHRHVVPVAVVFVHGFCFLSARKESAFQRETC
jgi:hypothetical protein